MHDCITPGYGCLAHYCCYYFHADPPAPTTFECREACFDDETCSYQPVYPQNPLCGTGGSQGSLKGRGPCPTTDVDGLCGNDPRACCTVTAECYVTTWDFCKEHGGTPMEYTRRCDPNPCPEDPMPCCLCRGQCIILKPSECRAIHGLPKIAYDGRCQYAHCDAENIQDEIERPCRAVRFGVGRDLKTGTSEAFLRYRPISQEPANPHEYTRVVGDDNCRTWWGNVSATDGAWTCWQWNRDDVETKAYTRLPVMIDPVTGQGRFWSTYKPVCPEYA